MVARRACSGLYYSPHIESDIGIALLPSRSRRGDYQSPALKDVRRTRLPLEGRGSSVKTSATDRSADRADRRDRRLGIPGKR